MTVDPDHLGQAGGPLRALPWAGEALCAETDPELWFPDKPGATYVTVDGTREATAKSICRRCPVIDPCRDYAMADPHLEGTWGGLTERERGTRRGTTSRRTT